MLMELPNIAVVMLSLFLNAIFSFGYYPNCWKKSQILMTDKQIIAKLQSRNKSNTWEKAKKRCW